MVKQILKHSFEKRPSILDDHDPDSKISQSGFKGFYHVFWIMINFFIINYVSDRLYHDKSFLNLEIFDQIQTDFSMIIMVWPKFYLIAHLSFLLEKLRQFNLNYIIIELIQHSTQSIPFIISIKHIMEKEQLLYFSLAPTHVGFILGQSCIFFFKVNFQHKMHSYTLTNRDLRKAYLQNPNKASEYPKNVNLKNFNYYLWVPTLSYEPSYPQSDRIRIKFLIRKFYQACSIMVLMYIMQSEYLQPAVQLHYDNPFLLFGKVLFPCFVQCICLFIYVWEVYLNFFAEITKFGDRQFYQDFWNSTNFSEFNQKWNRPVNEFLYRHCYQELIVHYQCSKSVSMFLTFFFSALLHEMLFVAVFKDIRPFITILMLFQIFVIAFMNKFTKKYPDFGNIFFWVSMICGNPLMIVLYNYVKFY